MKNAVFSVLALTTAMLQLSSADTSTKQKPPRLFHGYKVNNMTVESSNLWWQNAYRKVASTYHFEHAPLRKWPDVIEQGNPKAKEVALTFDDGPHWKTLPSLLEILKKENVKATFFVVGKMVQEDPDLIRDIVSNGHLVANHTFSHVNLSKQKSDVIRTEYQACSDLITSITGKAPMFCRPPGGRANPDVFKCATELGLTSVMWTDDPKDYANPGCQQILDYTLRKAKSGSVILLHEGVQQTMDILPTMIQSLKSKGFKFVRIDQMASKLKRTPVSEESAKLPKRKRVIG